MASTVSLHTPVSILLSITLITFIGRPTVSVEAAKNHQELLTNSSTAYTHCSIPPNMKSVVGECD